MKRLKYILLVGLLLSNLTAWGGDNLSESSEPAEGLRISLVAEPAESGSFNYYNKEVTASEGESYYLSAYPESDYRFVAWEQDGKVISTSSDFYYLMGSRDVTLTARFVYSPENPPEPVIRHQLFLESDPVGAGSFNWSSGSVFAEGEQVVLFAYGNNGYELAYWYRMEGNDTVRLSTDHYFFFTMEKKNVTLKAKYVFNPSNPGEPTTPEDKYYYIHGYSNTVAQGGTVDFQVYLNNSGNVSGIAFDWVSDANIAIDKKKVTLGDRCNSHTLQISENEGRTSSRFVISGDQSMQGSSGMILNIPLTVSSEMAPGYYTIQFDNVVVTLPNGVDKKLGTFDAQLNVISAPKKMGAEDYAALCDMYHRMNGAEWYQSWNIDSDMIDGNNWQGVTFTGSHVSEIDLDGSGVSGLISPLILSLPTLQKLNLRNNSLDWDVQELVDTLAKHNVKPVVADLNLNANRLKGDVSVLAAAFPELTVLDLSDNCFSEVSRPLSDMIKTLNLNYQRIPVKNVQHKRLAVKQELELPTIFTYSHANKAYRPVSSLDLYQETSNHHTTASLWYDSGSYNMTWYDWQAPSGSRFLLRSGDSDGYGSTIPLIFSFDKGDVNVDSVIDILDVQSTLNYIVSSSSYPFVYAAADVYEDSNLTVQDIVLIVDLVLQGSVTDTFSAVKASSFTRSQMVSPVRICIEDGKLVMYSDVEVAAADIVLSGCRQSQLRMLLNANRYQTAMKEKGDAVHLVVFSTAGETIPSGRTVLAELSSKEAAVAYADLADKGARRISTTVAPTGVYADVAGTVSIYNADNQVFVTLPVDIERVVADVIGMDGCRVDKKIFGTPSAGTLQVASDLVPGMYLVRLQLETSRGVVYKSQKVVISK